MAWRIQEQVLRGEIDNRTQGRVTGKIWLQDREQPLILDLDGNAGRDLAGHLLQFKRTGTPSKNLPDLEGLSTHQHGMVGDLTASHKVKVPECSIEEMLALSKAGRPYPWHWANCLYLEWFSEANGRVVLESTEFSVTIDPETAWSLSEAEEAAQQAINQESLTRFMETLVDTSISEETSGSPMEDEDAGQTLSPEEIEADAETARMDLLLDRVHYRMEREGLDEEEFDRVYAEERERLRHERGEPEPEPLTPEQEAERAAWIEEANAAAQEAIEEAEADNWKESHDDDDHPLVTRCQDLAFNIRETVTSKGWLREDDPMEHPVREIADGVMIASAKLGGALNTGEDEWPPDPLFAGDTLVRLKKAREALRDSLLGLQSADEQNLATSDWRRACRHEIESILAEVRRLIREVRSSLE